VSDEPATLTVEQRDRALSRARERGVVRCGFFDGNWTTYNVRACPCRRCREACREAREALKEEARS
jgi:hypothetical protein